MFYVALALVKFSFGQGPGVEYQSPQLHYIHFYYVLNKILNSDWLNTNPNLVDVWLAGSNVRQRNLMSGW